MTAGNPLNDGQPQASSAGQAGRKSEPLENAKNGSMVQDMQDLKRLGHDMKNMKTNSQLQEEGLVPDPIQE
ncbi:hypothetical protein GZH47_08215 [Paenibacillus rhizovicinus]|uniref:Uncharacterized protein n=1 Tax=Paenibacillus rhizovicinus TaxID=2704463 RepID=A0A6C0NXC9_9BACL|nr:hypothetical protein [Paenibacillus rhizovicinus]QHW30838.1 hypothetical protein GZH47_08215 [Paenibacillus rhizovicinus]